MLSQAVASLVSHPCETFRVDLVGPLKPIHHQREITTVVILRNLCLMFSHKRPRKNQSGRFDFRFCPTRFF